MDGVIIFLFLSGSALFYANLRNACAYCAVLVERGGYTIDAIVRQRNTLLLNAILVGGVILAVASAVTDGGSAGVSAPAKLLAFVGTVGLVFSQLFEQWALRQCERLAEQEALARRTEDSRRSR